MRQCVFVLMAVFALCATAFAATVGFRGDGTGRFPTAAPQMTWAANQRVVWATPLDSLEKPLDKLDKWSNACPIIVGDRIFVCAEPTTLICLNKADGRILWQSENDYVALLPPEEAAQLNEERAKVAQLTKQLRPLSAELRKKENELKATPDDEALKTAVAALKTQTAEIQQQMNACLLVNKWLLPKTHPTNGYSSATPTSDGKFVYAQYGNGIIACYDMDGKRQWMRFMEKPEQKDNWGVCASPLLIGDILIGQYSDNYYGLNANTGETIWRAKASNQWGSPQYMRIGTYDAVVTASAVLLNAANGKALAKLPSKPLDYNSPLVQDGVIYYVQGETVAMKPVMKDDGTVEIQVLWRAPLSKDRHYATPLVHDGLLYDVIQKGVLTVLDIQNGNQIYERPLGLGSKSTAYPSPILAGNVIIIHNDNGNSVVLEPGREYKELARNTSEGTRTTPVCEGKRMYLRGLRQMYCIGE